MKKVLLVTDGIFHPPFLARKALRNALVEMDGFEFHHIHSMEKLPNNIKEFTALVIYLHHKKISENALSALDDFVSNGGGILGVHSATASFKDQRHYFEIIGGRFIGHGKVEEIRVENSKSEIFGGIGNFVIKDELYIHELQPGTTPHFTAKHEGQEVPIVWTYQYSTGKVCYVLPGHTTRSLKHPSVQEILRSGLGWVCA